LLYVRERELWVAPFPKRQPALATTSCGNRIAGTTVYRQITIRNRNTATKLRELMSRVWSGLRACGGAPWV